MLLVEVVGMLVLGKKKKSVWCCVWYLEFNFCVEASKYNDGRVLDGVQSVV